MLPPFDRRSPRSRRARDRGGCRRRGRPRRRLRGRRGPRRYGQKVCFGRGLIPPDKLPDRPGDVHPAPVDAAGRHGQLSAAPSRIQLRIASIWAGGSASPNSGMRCPTSRSRSGAGRGCPHSARRARPGTACRARDGTRNRLSYDTDASRLRLSGQFAPAWQVGIAQLVEDRLDVAAVGRLRVVGQEEAARQRCRSRSSSTATACMVQPCTRRHRSSRACTRCPPGPATR